MSKQDKVAKLQESFKMFQQKDFLRISDIHKWLSENINDACELVTGERGRTLRFTGRLSCELEEKAGKLFSVGEGYWDYSSKRKHAPQLLAISDFFEGVTFVESNEPKAADKLKTKVILDMAKWSTVTDMLLYTRALSVFIFPVNSEENKRRDLADIELILKHTYPHMSIRQLNIACDIGLVHDQSSLYDWLKEMRVPQVNYAIAPPHNLEPR